MTLASQPAVHLPCPKCATPMRTLERSGIHLETCPDCRGVFLDRGELDRLLDLEAASTMPDDRERRPDRGPERNAGRSGSRDDDRELERGPYRDHDDDDDDDRRGRWEQGSGDPGRRSSRRGFLNDLLENIGG